jgi:hypothetical protein
MKHYLLAACLLTAAPVIAQTVPAAGQETAQPFKKANTVVIHTSDSLAVAYRKLAGVLLNAGYTIDRNDKELGFLNTKARPASNKAAMQTLRASVIKTQEGADILLKGSYSTPGLAAVSPFFMSGDSETEYRGMKGSITMSCWNELEKVAALYPNGRLAYKAQL